MRYRIEATIDGAIPVSTTVEGYNKTQAREKAKEGLAIDAREEGHDHITKDWIDIEIIEQV